MSPAPHFNSLQPPQLDDLHDERGIPPLSTSQQAPPDVADPACPEPLRPPDPSIHTGIDRLGWEGLTRNPLPMHERVSLITTIFSNKDEVEIVRHLCGDDAQSFINAVYEARSYILLFSKNGTVNFDSNAHVSSIRRWITSIVHCERGACAWYARSVAIMPCFQNHWPSHFPVTEPRICRCIKVGSRMYGRVHPVAWRSQLRC